MVSPDIDRELAELSVEQPVAEYNADGDLVVENADAENAAPLLGNAWQRPVKRPQPTEEQIERIRKIREEQSISPDEKLKRLMTFTPDGFNTQDPAPESTPEAANAPEMGNEPPAVETPVSSDPDPISGPSGQEAIYDMLGISDTDPSSRRGVFDPDRPMDSPEDNAEIMHSVKLSAEEVAERGQIQQDKKATEKALSEGFLEAGEQVDDYEIIQISEAQPERPDLTPQSPEKTVKVEELTVVSYDPNGIHEVAPAEQHELVDLGPEPENEHELHDPTPPDPHVKTLADLDKPEETNKSDMPTLSYTGEFQLTQEGAKFWDDWASHVTNNPDVRPFGTSPDPEQLNTAELTDLGTSENQPPKVTEVDTNATPEADLPVMEEKVEYTKTLVTPDGSVPDAQMGEPMVEIHVHQENAYIKDDPEETPPTPPEPEKAPDPEPEKEEAPVAGEEALQAALGDLPESTVDVGETDVIVDPTQQAPSNEAAVTLDEDDNITVENKRAALASISAVQTTAIFGDTAQQLFTPDDLDVVISNEIDPAHMVVPNMTADELQQYAVQSDPDQLQRSARQLFGTGNELYDITREGIQDLRINLTQPTSYPSRVHVSNQQFGSKEAQFDQGRLEKAKEEFSQRFPDKDWAKTHTRAIRVKDKDGNLKVVDDSFADSKVLFDKIAPNAVGKVQSVGSAKVAAMLIGGYRIVNLYHSGFTVQLCAPLMDQLARYYNTCIDKMSEFGRIFGQFAFLPAGVEKRAALLDLFEECTANSNLVNWNEPGMLRRAISVLDIPTIAWALASLMHPKGIDVEFLCYNNNDETGKPCRHAEKARIDINSMRYNNWTRMTPDMVQFVSSKEKRTLEDLAKYKADLYKAAGTDFVISKDGNWTATLHIPSAFEAEEAQRAYVAKMAETVQLDDLGKVEVYFRSKYLSAFAPYVKKVTYIRTDPDGSTKALEFAEADALERSLDNLQLTSEINLPDILSNYISEKTLTQIAFTYHPCPVCGKMPPEAVDGLVACDPEYAFFVWTMEKLRL